MVTLTDEEFHALSEKARAWDDFVKRRLTEGYVRGKLEIACIGSPTGLRVSDWTIITPFGDAKVINYPDGQRTIHMNTGDHVVLDHEIRLSIS